MLLIMAFCGVSNADEVSASHELQQNCVVETKPAFKGSAPELAAYCRCVADRIVYTSDGRQWISELARGDSTPEDIPESIKSGITFCYSAATKQSWSW
jgi:hypothetical protein